MATIVIEQTLLPRADPRLGRHVEHDSRSRRYAFRAPTGAPVASVRHQRHVPVLNQGDLGSCVGNAATGALGTGPNWVGNAAEQTLDEKFAVALYGKATALDNVPGTFPPDDTGSTGLAVAKACQQAGLISGYRHTFTLADALAALQVGPVIAGTSWYDGMFDPAKDGRLSITGNLAGGHEYAVDEVDAANQRVWLTNSWSTSWGVQGRAYLTFEDFASLLADEGDVVLFTPLTQPAPTPTPAPPAPAPEDAGNALWAATHDWATAAHTGSNARAAKAVRAWAAATGRG